MGAAGVVLMDADEMVTCCLGGDVMLTGGGGGWGRFPPAPLSVDS